MSSLITNVDAFRLLIDKYRSLTVEMIVFFMRNNRKSYASWDSTFRFVLNYYTGFGSFGCILCKQVNGVCEDCLHFICAEDTTLRYIQTPCTIHPTYNTMKNANRVHTLLKAVNARADYLETLVAKYKEEQDG